MAKSGYFLKEFFKDKREVGAISPSSRFLAKRMCAPINFSRAKVLVELGPGNGVMTKEILKNMSSDAQLYVFETNETFYNELTEKFDDSRVTFIHESAERVHEYLKEQNIAHTDYIVSSLPYTVFPKELKHNILDACVKALSKEGLYMQFQYSLNAHKLLKEKFESVKLDFTPMNFPPAFVYRCSLK